MLDKDVADESPRNTAEAAHRPTVERRAEAGSLTVVLGGPWTTRTVSGVDPELRTLENETGVKSLVIDVSSVTAMDTAGAWVVKRLAAAHERAGSSVEIRGARHAVTVLLSAVDDAIQQPASLDEGRRRFWPMAVFEAVGRTMYQGGEEFLLAMHILGATVRGAQMKRGRGHGVNLAAIATQIDRMGIGAIPVVLLMSTIVGAIVAQQGAFQLRYFGAEIFVVDLVGILVLREMGVLLTAIMIAGRTGSAITAEIGSMKMREEVDALTVIGLNPIGVLVFPRLVALVIVLPCLTVASNVAAILGAMAIGWFYSGISPEAFFDRMSSAVDYTSVLSGLIKAPFMAMIIGIVASVEGMKVGGSAESLGRHVTASVVKSIFIVIVIDGMFAIFYAAIDF